MTEVAWPLPMDSLSPSSLAKFSRCPEQWRRSYIKGEWDRASVATVVGSAAHSAAEINFRQKTTTGTDLPMGDIEFAFAEAFDAEVEESGGAGEIDWVMSVGREKQEVTPGKAKDTGLPVTRLYRQRVAPFIQPIGAEEWFRFKVEGVPVPIRGKIDLVEGHAKTDIKFGRSLKARPDTAWRLQGLTYLLANETSERDGTVRLSDLGRMPFQWHTATWGSDRYAPRIITPDESPELVMPRTDKNVHIAESLIRSTVDAMLAYWHKFGPDDPWPGALQHPWVCNYCSFGPEHDNSCFWWSGVREESQLTLI
jgi:PD-(D/E)XK nuclease superfamily